jgi:regenerating islet-derived protein 4
MRKTLFFHILATYSRGAYNDYKNKFELVTTPATWWAADTYCRNKGTELAPILRTSDIADINAKRSGSLRTYTGVRCSSSGVWSANGPTYVTNSNSNWCTGEPNSGCTAEGCLEVYASGCWNDVSCSTPLAFLCGITLCKRE